MDEGSRGRGGQSRREFLGWVSRRGMGLGLLGAAAPAVLAACASDDDPAVLGSPTMPASPGQVREEARAIIGEVIDFALTSSDWARDFGFVTLNLHKGVVDGRDVCFVRTDASDRAFAESERLVWARRSAG